MPFVQVSLIEGRSPDVKEQLIAQLTETVVRVLGARRESVRVVLHEIPEAHWGIAGVSRREMSRRSESR
jgi:4-oxalocrotonate tautomerase